MIRRVIVFSWFRKYPQGSSSVLTLVVRLKRVALRGHRRNDATLSLFVVIDAVPHSSRRSQETAHRKKDGVTAIA